MTEPAIRLVSLSEMEAGELADVFALLSEKSPAVTRDGKPYYRVTFRDALREVSFPIWQDAPLYGTCRDDWQPGEFYKVRAEYRETNYGPQLEIHKIRPTTEQDAADGFDPNMCQARSRFDAETMFLALVEIAQSEISTPELKDLVVELLETHREQLLAWPAASQNHHAFVGGYLEHVLSVTRNAILLAQKYAAEYDDLEPPLSVELVAAGAILHDIGKLTELRQEPQGATYTPAGRLVGHILLGRDLVRDAAARHALAEDMLLRLEHIIISHQRLPEWGSPKPPMTPEALLVHYADDVDAKFNMMYAALRGPSGDGEFTDSRNPLRQRIYRGPAE